MMIVSRFYDVLAWLALLFSRYEKVLATFFVGGAIFGGIATYTALSAAPSAASNPATISQLLVFDLFVLMGVVGLVIRRGVSLYIARRRGRSASQLHVRMVSMFAILATAPAILLVLFSTFFFHLGVQSWFSTQVRTAVTEAHAVAEAYLEEHRKVISTDLLAMAGDIDRQPAILYARPTDQTRFMDTQSFLRNFNESILFESSGRVLARGGVGLAFDPSDIPPGTLQTAGIGEAVVYTSPDEEEKIQAVVRLNSSPDTYLYVSRSVDPTVLSYVSATRDASSNYTMLEHQRAALQFRFFAVYILVALLLLSVAVWGGLYIAGQLVNPIEGLITAAEMVSSGNLAVRVPETQGLGEFNNLARTFNRMTVQLEQQRRELIDANHELDGRRQFIETVLAGVTSGVMAIDEQDKIRLANQPASKILGQDVGQLIGQKMSDLLPELDMGALLAKSDAEDARQVEIGFNRRDHQYRTLLVRLAPETGTVQGSYHAILTFDDITELQSAQRKSAWSDVARRVAHEIKNPLTPIQLSAERLRRRFSKEIPENDLPIFQQCVDTIIRHVADIGRMVSEFASFARMPEPIMKSDDLGGMVRDLVALHAGAMPRVSLRMAGDLLTDTVSTPVMMDAPQMRQAVTNLILNAMESVAKRVDETPDPSGLVLVALQQREGQYILSILDNGLGFPKGIPLERLTEPYVTFRDKGTGLGLAIVKKIIHDHKGSLRLDGPDGIRDQYEWGAHGAVVSMVLPIPLDINLHVRQDSHHAA